jgi:hypothetical protein
MADNEVFGYTDEFGDRLSVLPAAPGSFVVAVEKPGPEVVDLAVLLPPDQVKKLILKLVEFY